MPKNSSTQNNISVDELIKLDKQHLWHPYSSFTQASPAELVTSAEGVELRLADGRIIIDGMASWWSVIHGYNHPTINSAVQQQLEKFAHVMFAGFTHEPAIRLAETLIKLSPKAALQQELKQVFFSDSGSVAVEIALKMALQYWQSKEQPQRNKFLAFKKGYHGDTFGAMSVCDPESGMHQLFQVAQASQLFAEAPACQFDAEWQKDFFANTQQMIEKNHAQIAAVIIEPIVQAAGGMNFYSPKFLQALRKTCDEFGLLLIADEIATGFGRTGKFFACEHAAITPDILCAGKAMTGGYITLAATLCTERISGGISNGKFPAFMHGPTYMANPLACAAANASIDLLLANNWQAKVKNIEQQLKTELEPCRTLNSVRDVRVLGAIGVVELKEKPDAAKLQQDFLKEGVWIRPFGKLVYLMPAYSMTEKELSKLTRTIYSTLKA